MTTADFGPLLPGLAASRRVIVCDPQAHGRTADTDRPLTYEGMADDAAALLDHLGVARADTTVRRPQHGWRHGDPGRDPASAAGPHAGADLGRVPQRRNAAGAARDDPDDHPGDVRRTRRSRPRTRPSALQPDRFPELVAKLKQLDGTPFAWPEDAIGGITAPTLIVTGDADASVVEHAVAMFRLWVAAAWATCTALGRPAWPSCPARRTSCHPASPCSIGRSGCSAIILVFLDAPEAVPAD